MSKSINISMRITPHSSLSRCVGREEDRSQAMPVEIIITLFLFLYFLKYYSYSRSRETQVRIMEACRLYLFNQEQRLAGL